MNPNPLPPVGILRRAVLAALLAASAVAQAAVGTVSLPPGTENGPVTVFYPTDTSPRLVEFGPGVSARIAPDAPVARGNGSLVMVSHGTGGGPWVYSELIAELVGAGFVVAVPEHRHDNRQDHSDPGPASFDRRPGEISHGIDAVLRDPRFAPLLRSDRIGLYGMSAGGHTALSMAGGRWSPAGLRDHCEAHLAQDFSFCTGLNLRLTGGPLDGLKQWVVRKVIRWRFDDATPREYHDARIAAIVAAVPVAADFDMASLVQPRVPLALVTSGQDRWLVPRFHAERVLAACKTCEHLAHLPDGGHGAYLGPLPSAYGGMLAEMLNDPPGFDRSVMAGVNRAIVAYMVRHLGTAGEAPLP